MSMLTASIVLCFVFWCQLLLNPPSAQFSEPQVLHDNFVQQGAENLQDMTTEFCNCEVIILPHKLHKVVRNDGWIPTVLIKHMLSTCLNCPHQWCIICLLKTWHGWWWILICTMFCAFKTFITISSSQSEGAGIRASIFNHCIDATVRTRNFF